MPHEKRKLLLISVVAISVSLLILCLNLLEIPVTLNRDPLFLNKPRIPVFNFFLLIPLLIFAITSLSYYFLSRRLEAKLEKNLMLIVKLVKKNIKTKDLKEVIKVS